ncbi:hypothetical protein L3i22_042190 [Actinoplanes sp. L3-i22]|nr:hypothetical protein L3i22_042190 [Actinoplanes sp. L3-i22]
MIATRKPAAISSVAIAKPMPSGLPTPVTKAAPVRSFDFVTIVHHPRAVPDRSSIPE